MPGVSLLPRRTTVILALVLSLFGMTLTFANAQPAHALCVSPSLVGDWHNTNTATSALTRVVVGFSCSDVVLCDENGHCSGGQSYFTLRGFGKCHPTDCDWGTKVAADEGGGWQMATYTYSWATKYLWVKTYPSGSLTYLRVYTWTDFTAADGRTDYATDEWFLK